MSLKRYAEDNAAYFVSAVTYERNTVFADRMAAELLLNIILYNKFICSYRVFGFVIMPDHFHMLIQSYGDMNLSDIIRKIKGNFSRFYNMYTGKPRPIWQKSFYDRGIRSNGDLKNTLAYMHNNPVNKGLIADGTEYEFSSCSYYEAGDQRFALLMDCWEW